MRREKVETLITGAGDRIIVPTAEESQVIDERMASDPDGFELDDAWFEVAKTTKELFPEAHGRAVRRKEALRAGMIPRVSVTLDQETVAWFKAQTGEDGKTGGTRWLDTGRSDPPGPCQGRCRPGVPFAACGELIPPGATPQKRPCGRVDGPERGLDGPRGENSPSSAANPQGGVLVEGSPTAG